MGARRFSSVLWTNYTFSSSRYGKGTLKKCDCTNSRSYLLKQTTPKGDTVIYEYFFFNEKYSFKNKQYIKKMRVK